MEILKGSVWVRKETLDSDRLKDQHIVVKRVQDHYVSFGRSSGLYSGSFLIRFKPTIKQPGVSDGFY